MELKIYTDGGSRNNPGPAAAGIVICDKKNNLIESHSKFLGEKTNNQAEYLAVIEALKLAKKFNPQIINFFLDSKLVVEQLNGKFKIKDQKLASLFVEAYNLSLGYKKITYEYIPREKNVLADKQVNLCLDKHHKS